jgi:hypothetical protein
MMLSSTLGHRRIPASNRPEGAKIDPRINFHNVKAPFVSILGSQSGRVKRIRSNNARRPSNGAHEEAHKIAARRVRG